MKDKILEALRGYFAAGLLAKDTDTRAWMGEDDQGPIHIDLSDLASHIAAALEAALPDIAEDLYFSSPEGPWYFGRGRGGYKRGLDAQAKIQEIILSGLASTPDPTAPTEGTEGR